MNEYIDPQQKEKKGFQEGDLEKHKFGNDLKSFILSVIDNILELPDRGKRSKKLN